MFVLNKANTNNKRKLIISYQNYEYNSGDAGTVQRQVLILSALFWIFYFFKRGSGLGCLVDVIRCKVGSDDGAVDDYKEGGGDYDNDDGHEDDVAMQICE